MTKYNNLIAETLDRIDPDESIGSVDELGWFGLYEAERTILAHDSDGFVEALTFDTLEETLTAFNTAITEYDEYDHE